MVAVITGKACLGLQVLLYITIKNILDLIDSIPLKNWNRNILSCRKYFWTSINIFFYFLNNNKYILLEKYLHFLLEHPLWSYSLTFPGMTDICKQVHVNITILMCTTSADTIYQILYLKILFWPLTNWFWRLTASIFKKNEGGPHCPTWWGNVGHPFFFKKGPLGAPHEISFQVG